MESVPKLDEAQAAPAGALPRQTLVVTAWVIMLLASNLPVILIQELSGMNAAWWFWVRIALLGAMAVIGTLVSSIRPLRNFFVILLSVYLAERLIFSGLGKTPLWVGWFGSGSVPFTTMMSSDQLLRLAVSLLIILALVLMRYRREQFFLVLGNLRAPIRPIRWLGFPKPDPWTKFGGQWAVYISLGTLAFLLIAGRPQVSALLQVLGILPLILIFAAMNAFNEEMTYRASFLATLEKAVGQQHALWISALFFGIGHFYGVPYGVIGVILASFLGLMLGKAMLETRGFFWAWFIHFLQDVAIFTFLAAGSITAGGK